MTTGGTGTAYTVSTNRTLSAYHNGLELSVEFHDASGDDATLDANSVAAQALVWPDGTAIAENDISAGTLGKVKYDGSNTRWVLMTVAGAITQAGQALLDDADAAAQRATLGIGTVTKENIAGLSTAVNEAKGSDIASASTTDIGAATGNYVEVTGTTTITGPGTVQAGTRRVVRFTGALMLTHNATRLILPTGANITTAPNDVATFVSLGSGHWICAGYLRANG